MEYDGLHADLSRRIIGIFYEVANELGFGFVETVYRRSLLIALREHGLHAEEEMPIPVNFHGQSVGIFYADIVVGNKIVLELKTSETITVQHEAQLLHYLRSSSIEVGLVLAFGERAKIKRIVMENTRKPHLRT